MSSYEHTRVIEKKNGRTLRVHGADHLRGLSPRDVRRWTCLSSSASMMLRIRSIECD